MKLLLLAFALASFGQTIPLIGTVDKVAGDRLYLKSGSVVYTDSKTETRQSLSALQDGDEISARCERLSSGKLMARKLSTEAVQFRAVIEDVRPGRLVVKVKPGESKRIVNVYAETGLSTSVKDLSAGEEIYVYGLALSGEEVDATRISIYHTDIPMDSFR